MAKSADFFNEAEQLDLSPEQEQRLLFQCIEEYESDRNNRTEWATDLAAWQRMVAGGRGAKSKNSPWPGSSNVDLPVSKIACAGMKATLFAGYFTQKPFIRFPSDQRNLESFVEWEVERELDARPRFDHYIGNCVDFGTAIGYLYPGKNDKGKFKLCLENIENIDDFFIPSNCYGPDAIKRAHHVGLRTHPQLWELFEKQRDGIFKNVAMTDGMTGKDSIAERSKIDSEKQTFDKITDTPTTQNRLTDAVTMLEWYTKFQVGPKKGNPDPEEEPKDVVVWFCYEASRKIYRAVENKENLRPFFHSVLEPVPGRFHGVGLPKILEQLQDQVNVIYNQRNDAGQLANQPYFFYNPMSGFKPSEVVIAPGRGIPIDNPADVNLVKPLQLPSHMFEEEKLCVNYVERLTGVGDLVLGSGVQGAGTATGVRSILQQGSLRMDVIMLRIGWGLRDFVLQLIRWNKLLREEGVKVRVTGTAEDVTLSSADMKDWDDGYVPPFEVNSLTGNRAAEREMMLLFHDKLMLNPLVAQDPKALFGAVQLLASVAPTRRPELILPTTYFQNLENQRLASNVDQENSELAMGRAVETAWMDDDVEHISAHRILRNKAPEAIKGLIDAHVNGHLYAMRLKMMGAATGQNPGAQIPSAQPGAAPGGAGGGAPNSQPAPFAPGPGPGAVPGPGMMLNEMGSSNPLSIEYQGEPGNVGPNGLPGVPMIPQAIQAMGRPREPVI